MAPGAFQFKLGITTRQKGWSSSRKTHTQAGKSREIPVEPLALLEVINSAIEDIYLARSIYPGARLSHPTLGPGTVITCSKHRPFFFSFVPDEPGADESAEEDDYEPGEIRLRYFDPEEMDSHRWGIPGPRGEESQGWVFKHLKTDRELQELQLTLEQRDELVSFSKRSNSWQLGEAIRFLIKELKQKVR